MAKSLSSILSQIERLQKEAASIQSEVIARVRKEIEKYGLTAEQLFGATSGRRRGAASKSAKGKASTAAKYADGTGNTWGGRGKRPDWLRQALEAGKALEDFLIAGVEAAVKPAATRKRAAKAAPAKRTKAAAKKRAPAKKATTRKARAKPAGEAAAE